MADMSELNEIAAQLAQFGEATARSTFAKVDPKASLIKRCADDIKSIKAGATKGAMYKKVGSNFKMTARNGIRVIEVTKGKPDYMLSTAELAMSWLEVVLQLAEAGKFDGVFAAHALEAEERAAEKA